MTTTQTPANDDELAEVISRAHSTGTALYPVGGATSLSYGLPAKQAGEQLSVAGLDRLVDYPVRDLTVTVEAGMNVQALNELLAKSNQELPFDVPQAPRATVGGVVACNWSGPRRFGCGTVRDYVIGISAIDGRGETFSGGGRVVKNVAGYDFCKLLTGSLGTLGVITQVTFKVRPQCISRVCLLATVSDLTQAEAAVSTALSSKALPAALEFFVGPAWSAWNQMGVLAVLEGTSPEVAWMKDQLIRDWNAGGITSVSDLGSASDLWPQIIEFSAEEAPLTIKASIRPSGVIPFIAAIRKLDPEASVLAHAGSGIVFARFAAIPAGGASKMVLNVLQPLAAAQQGHAHIIAAEAGIELTRQAVWGSQDAAGTVMASVKRAFDPKNILNPGRFIFP